MLRRLRRLRRIIRIVGTVFLVAAAVVVSSFAPIIAVPLLWLFGSTPTSAPPPPPAAIVCTPVTHESDGAGGCRPVLAPPTNVSVLPIGCGGAVSVTWDPVSRAERYEVSINGGSWVSVTPPRRHIFSDLTVSSNQTVTVRAHAWDSSTPGRSAPTSASGLSSGVCNELNAGNCLIPAGANNCNASVVWDMTGNPSPFRIENETNSNTIIGNTASGTQSATISYGNNTINAFSNNMLINTDISTATCVPQHFFLDLTQTCQPNPIITITPEPIWVRSGDTAEVNININAPYDLECTLAGDIANTPLFTHTGSINPVGDYSIDTVPISATRILSVSCNTPANDLQPPANAETRINMVPRMQEM